MKPQNILVDHFKHKAIICDFGSAKKLVKSKIIINFSWSKFGIYLFAMLSSAWTYIWSHELYVTDRYVVDWVHFGGNGERSSSISCGLTNWPANINNKSIGNSLSNRGRINEPKIRYEGIQQIPKNKSNSMEKCIKY